MHSFDPNWSLYRYSVPILTGWPRGCDDALSDYEESQSKVMFVCEMLLPRMSYHVAGKCWSRLTLSVVPWTRQGLCTSNNLKSAGGVFMSSTPARWRSLDCNKGATSSLPPSFLLPPSSSLCQLVVTVGIKWASPAQMKYGELHVSLGSDRWQTPQWSGQTRTLASELGPHQPAHMDRNPMASFSSVWARTGPNICHKECQIGCQKRCQKDNRIDAT